MKRSLIFLLLLCSLTISGETKDLRMHYYSPAEEWMQALPVGNGRLGAMIWGRTDTEKISLGESTMWSGAYDLDMNPKFGKQRLDSLRQLFLEGKIREGNQIAWNELHGYEHSFGSQVPLGDLLLQFEDTGKIEHYQRELDLKKGICRVAYTRAGQPYEHEYFCSYPDSLLIIRIKSRGKGRISFSLGTTLLRPEATTHTVGKELRTEGRATQPGRVDGGVRFAMHVFVKQKGGEQQTQPASLLIKNAKEAVIYVDLRTDLFRKDYTTAVEQTIATAQAKGYSTLRKRHIADFSRLFDRTDLRLGEKDNDYQPTDQRRAALAMGHDDPALQALFFQYGRYLTISSSRENSPLPIALQGFFNDNLACNMGWNNDYHLDINTEQNYWLTGPGNLSECDAPLIRYVQDLSRYGSTTAHETYGCRGWTAHTVANVWGFTAPSGCIAWGLFPTAGSWIATHLWSHYLYTQDTTYLRQEAYPALKGNALFLTDYLQPNSKTGLLMSGPSISPENSFIVDGQNTSACLTPTVDRVLAHEILSDCMEACRILHTDSLLADTLQDYLLRLPTLQINQYGGVAEWDQDYAESSPNHRHMSHLLALYPFRQITVEDTPELAKAAETTIQHRLSATGWEDVEWSRANAICFYARLREPEQAYASVNQLLGSLSRENLFTISPKGIAGAPWDIFAIDGNTAGAAGIAEMLLQSEAGTIYLLPCLPEKWQNGSFRGLCVPGAEVDAQWHNGKLQRALIHCRCNGTYRIIFPDGKNKSLDMQSGKAYRIKGF